MDIKLLLTTFGLAFLAELGDAHVLALVADLLDELGLDRQAVAVPSRHIRCAEAGHGPVLDHDILEDLVQGMAQVDIAVGVRRPIVKDIGSSFPAPRPPSLYFMVNILFFPRGLHLFLNLFQVGPDGKVSFWQI